MKNKKIVTLLLPYIVAIAGFIAINALYFSPQFDGKSIQMHDVTQYLGTSQDIREHKQAFDEDPQWAGRLFGGMPAYMISFDFNTHILKSLDNVARFMGEPSAYIFIAMLGFFIMLMLWGINPWIGIIPSLAYGLSTYFFIIIGAGHIAKIVALAYAPMMMGAVFYTYRRNMWLGAALTALFAAIEIMVNHPQITYYFVMVLIAFWINEGIRAFKTNALPHFVKATGLLALAAMLAVGANFSSLYYVATHTNETIRGGTELSQKGSESASKQSGSKGAGLDIGYATAWSYGKIESFNMFIPNLMGGASDGGFSEDGPVASSLVKYNARGMASHLPAYWGDQPITSGPTYIGAVMIFLSVLGLFLLKGRSKWWIFIITFIALLLSWGSNFMWFTELFFNYFPGYNKFRTVSMILVIAEWSVPFIAALILNKLWKGQIDRASLIRAMKFSLGITGGIAILFWLFGSGFEFNSAADSQLPQDVVHAMQTERLAMLKADSLRSLLFVILTAVVVLLLAFDKIKRGVFVLLLAVCVCADMIPVNLRYMPQSKFVDNKEVQIKPTSADVEILKDKELGYRVANFSVSPFNDATTSYFHRSIGGYHGAKLQRYQDIIDRHLSAMNWNVYNMLNTKYIITADKESGQLAVQPNLGANGAAWFVDKIIYTDTPDAEIDALGTIDTKTEAVIDDRFKSQVEGAVIGRDSADRITLTEYRPNYLKYEYIAKSEGVAVFSEIYYDQGWTAYIDGQPAPYFRADYILRAMVLPAGDHTVEFRFKAPDFELLSNITIISSLLILAAIVAAAVAGILKFKKERHNA